MSHRRQTYRGSVSLWKRDLNEHLTAHLFLPKFDNPS